MTDFLIISHGVKGNMCPYVFSFSVQNYFNDNGANNPVKRTHFLDRELGFNICLFRN